MSETPQGGHGSGTEGFAPPGGGFTPPAGGPPQYYPAPTYAPPFYPGGYYGAPIVLRPQTSGMAVAGMVFGISSLVLFWASLLGPLLAVMGIVFSAIGMSQSSKPGWTGMGMAVTGLVCSLVTAAIWVFLVILIASLLA